MNSYIQPYDTKNGKSQSPNRRLTSPVMKQTQQSPQRFSQYRGYQDNDPISPERYLTIDQALHKSGSRTQVSPQPRGLQQSASQLGIPAVSYHKQQLSDGRVSLRMKTRNGGGLHETPNPYNGNTTQGKITRSPQRSSQYATQPTHQMQNGRRDTRVIQNYQASPKRESVKVMQNQPVANQQFLGYQEDVTLISPSPNRRSTAGRPSTQGNYQQTQGTTPVQNRTSKTKSYRERYQELNGGNMFHDQSVQHIDYDKAENEEALETQVPPN